METRLYLSLLGLVLLLPAALGKQALPDPEAGAYVGYVYPAGGQQGTTFQVRMGGQRGDGAYGATVSGEGVHARLVETRRQMSTQEMRILREQLAAIEGKPPEVRTEEDQQVERSIRIRSREHVSRPANNSIPVISILEVTVDDDAEAGAREIRLLTPKGLSNPLPFHIGQVPEITRKAIFTTTAQMPGREEVAVRKQRKSRLEEVDGFVTLPCTLNGQVSFSEVHRYHFKAQEGQTLVVSTLARQLIPYIADAVPGWFQAVLTLYDANGKEVAFNDDFRFKPDPVILYEVPETGEYVLSIHDALFRGREDFVYRITVGELPFLSGAFPLGGRAGSPVEIKTTGWNLGGARLDLPDETAQEGVHHITAKRKNFVSNPVPCARDTLPECLEKEGNDDVVHAQKVAMPVIVNGRSDRPGDWDVYRIEVTSGDIIVAEVQARRLDSPLDSVLRLTDSSGRILAANDDHADPGCGLSTHHADSYLMVKVPTEGDYYVHLRDISNRGGETYGYRLRISGSRPDFALRTVPSSVNFGSAADSTIAIYVIRKDGYGGPITLRLKDPPEGFTAKEVTMPFGEEKAVFSIQTSHEVTKQPFEIAVEGHASIDGREVVREAVPTEDWMQAFLWRHLVPTQKLLAHVHHPSLLPARRGLPGPPSKDADTVAGTKRTRGGKGGRGRKPGKFQLTKAQKHVASQLRSLGKLYQDWLITEEFYLLKAAEYESIVSRNQ
jgi:hypothetical protein